MKEEVTRYKVFAAGGRELVFGCNVFVSCKYTTKERFFLKITDEISRYGVFALAEVISIRRWQVAISKSSLVAPKAHGCSPKVIGEERHMHAYHDGKSLAHLLLEETDLSGSHIAIDIVQRDEVHSIDYLALKADIEGIDALQHVARMVLITLVLFFFRFA